MGKRVRRISSINLTVMLVFFLLQKECRSSLMVLCSKSFAREQSPGMDKIIRIIRMKKYEQNITVKDGSCDAQQARCSDAADRLVSRREEFQYNR